MGFWKSSIEKTGIECLSSGLSRSQFKNIILGFHYKFPISKYLDDEKLAILANAIRSNRGVVGFHMVDELIGFCNIPLYKEIQHCTERNRLLNTYPQYSAIIKQAYAEIGLGLPAECDSLKNITGKFALFNQCKGKLENLPLELKEHLDQIRNIYEIAKKPRV